MITVGRGITQQHVPGHGVAEQGQTPIATRQPRRESRHLLQGPQQDTNPPRLILDADHEGLGVAAMAREVKGHRSIAVAGEGHRIGLHQLL